MNIDKTVDLWFGVIKPKLPLGEDSGSSNWDKRMVMYLSREILDRWREEANVLAEGDKEAAKAAFKTTYAKRKVLAQGAIVAVIELIKSVGEGTQLPEQFRELMN